VSRSFSLVVSGALTHSFQSAGDGRAERGNFDDVRAVDGHEQGEDAGHGVQALAGANEG
jgi:hypothetical protein